MPFKRGRVARSERFWAGRGGTPEERGRVWGGDTSEEEGDVLGQLPRMQAPTPGAMLPYGRAAMDLYGRGAAVQAGHAMRGLEGMNPAARAEAMARISQVAGAGAGQAGVQGMLGGGGMMQQAGMGNLGQQSREQALRVGISESALSRGFQEKMARWQMEQQQKMRQQQMMSQMFGGFASLIPGLGGLLGGGGGGGTNYNQPFNWY